MSEPEEGGLGGPVSAPASGMGGGTESAANVRRLTGATKGVAYGEANTPLRFMGSGTKYLENCYNFTRKFSSDEIETTAYGDYPFGTSESGFIDVSFEVSMRHAVKADGSLADDLKFLEEHCNSRLPFQIAVLDDRYSAKPNGWIFTVVATSADESGDMKSAQDHSYTLKRCAGKYVPDQIVAGVATAWRPE